MSSENSKALILGSIAVTMLLAWQMKSHSSFASKLPEMDQTAFMGNRRLPAATTKSTATAVVTTSDAATSYRDPNSKAELVSAIHAANECYASEICDFPNTDPKSYELSVGQNLKNLLSEYRNKFGRDPRNRAETESLAREFIRSGDEYVQETSLQMFSDSPPSAVNLQVLTEALKGTSDPLLVDQAMNELKRYLGTSEEHQVHEFLGELLGQGGVFSSEKAAQKILLFINPQSFSTYDNLARSLPSTSKVASDLRTALDEYRRLQTGG
jgi:hypothetical protein